MIRWNHQISEILLIASGYAIWWAFALAGAAQGGTGVVGMVLEGFARVSASLFATGCVALGISALVRDVKSPGDRTSRAWLVDITLWTASCAGIFWKSSLQEFEWLIAFMVSCSRPVLYLFVASIAHALHARRWSSWLLLLGIPGVCIAPLVALKIAGNLGWFPGPFVDRASILASVAWYAGLTALFLPSPRREEARAENPDQMNLEPDGDELVAIMSRSYDTGIPDLAARHDGHQP